MYVAEQLLILSLISGTGWCGPCVSSDPPFFTPQTREDTASPPPDPLCWQEELLLYHIKGTYSWSGWGCFGINCVHDLVE